MVHVANKWTVVVSAAIPEYGPNGPTIRLRILDSKGKVDRVCDGEMYLIRLEVGRLFGGDSEIVAVETSGSHVYTIQSAVWLLPNRGKPKELASENGNIDRFETGPNAGVWVDLETYDGINGSSKGRKPTFFR